jgi:formate-dependent nitrite reductase cytochrome c552 subunit
MLLRQALSQLPGRAPVRAPHESDRVQSGNSRVEVLMARNGELEAALLKAQQATTAAEVVTEMMLADCRRQADKQLATAQEVAAQHARQRDEAMAQRDALRVALEAACEVLQGLQVDLSQPHMAAHYSLFIRARRGAIEAAATLGGAAK